LYLNGTRYKVEHLADES